MVEGYFKFMPLTEGQAGSCAWCGAPAQFYKAALKRFCCSVTARACPAYKVHQAQKTLAHANAVFGPPEVRKARALASGVKRDKEKFAKEQNKPLPDGQLCEFGCGRPALHRLMHRAHEIAEGERFPWAWSCSKRYQQCPAARAEAQNLMKATALKRHGVEHHMQDPEVIASRRATCTARYGVPTTLQDPAIRKRIAQTNLERYGNVDAIASPEIMAKHQATVQSRFGVDNVFQDPAVKRKIVDHWMVRLGVPHPGQSPEGAEQRSATAKLASIKREAFWKEHYGVAGNMGVPEVLAKSRATSVRNFGVPHFLQNPARFRVHYAAMHGHKDFTMPSGRVVSLQGYEHHALAVLLRSHEEPEFVWEDRPAIRYFYGGRERAYHPDFFLPAPNLLIEVKSWYTLMYDAEMNAAKQAACLAQGYRFEFWVGADKNPGRHPFTIITIPLADYLRERAEAIAKSSV